MQNIHYFVFFHVAASPILQHWREVEIPDMVTLRILLQEADENDYFENPQAGGDSVVFSTDSI
ncbi:MULTISPECIES: hypothetical protein [unclassified Mesotoga]|uniref:hypothetical protein n=1 Tax=unclassified Mesotoga TaxID=1184398 RepID=UPI000DA68E74|nr:MULTISPECIES: hypothetical protein [unclassified Mesotoga]